MPLTPPNSPLHPLGASLFPQMPLYPFWPLSTYSPCQPPIHPWHSLHLTPLKQPLHHLGPPIPPDAPIPLVAPEYWESLQPPIYLWQPLHPLALPKWLLHPLGTPNDPWCPYTLLALSTYSPCQPPIHPWYHLHPLWSPSWSQHPTPPSVLLSSFSFSIVVTLQLTVFMQLKCSFSFIVIFNCCHFATDCLHAVKMLIFYCHHFQLSSHCNWPSSGLCPVYNIPSVDVKGTSSVLWSSANFSSSFQNIHYKAPVASQHWKTNKVVWTWKDDWLPRELLLMKDLLPKRVAI